MKNFYKDIRSRISEPPTWHDQDGVPRYGKFTPRECPDIYSNCVLLMRIGCQACPWEGDVEMHAAWFNPLRWHGTVDNPLPHYGDPPYHQCPSAGETMNSVPGKIVEFWVRLSTGWKKARWQIKRSKRPSGGKHP